MTAKEAIEKLERNKAIMCHGCMHPQMVGWCEDHCQMPEALDMAIQALSNADQHVQEVMIGNSLIKRQDAIDAWWHDEVFFGNQRDDMTKEQWLDYITDVISSLPSEVVMCKDCKWWNGNTETMHNNHLCCNWSKFGSIDVGADDFCSYGERREP